MHAMSATGRVRALPAASARACTTPQWSRRPARHPAQTSPGPPLPLWWRVAVTGRPAQTAGCSSRSRGAADCSGRRRLLPAARRGLLLAAAASCRFRPHAAVTNSCPLTAPEPAGPNRCLVAAPIPHVAPRIPPWWALLSPLVAPPIPLVPPSCPSGGPILQERRRSTSSSRTSSAPRRR